MSTHGQYQSVALELIGMIAGKAVENGVAYRSTEVVNELKANIAIKIQKNNALIMLASLSPPVTTTATQLQLSTYSSNYSSSNNSSLSHSQRHSQHSQVNDNDNDDDSSIHHHNRHTTTIQQQWQ